jgi:hypothetical protein
MRRWLLTTLFFRIDRKGSTETWDDNEVVPAAKRQLRNYAWITSENFLGKAWLHEWGRLSTAIKNEFEENLWGLDEDCLSTHDYWKDDLCSSGHEG